MVAFWMPSEMVRELDQRVFQEDTDRSKWIRNAMRRQFEAMGITIKHAPGKSIGVAAAIAAIVAGGIVLHHGLNHVNPDSDAPALAGGIE